MNKKRKSMNVDVLGDPMASLRKATTLTYAERDNAIRQMREITGGIKLPAVVLKGRLHAAADFKALPFQ